jgi:acetylornithine/succinyldiaminopimelate/putrescine aminotransferase
MKTIAITKKVKNVLFDENGTVTIEEAIKEAKKRWSKEKKKVVS